MAQRKPTSFELTFAYRLIRWLTGRTATNSYLVLAIIAWVRRESGQTYLGNNPLNIRNSIYSIGRRQTRNGNGSFAIFKDLNMAAKASAYFLTSNRGYGYEAVVSRIRDSAPKGLTGKALEKWQIKQAHDFMYNIALSKWSSDHYGYGKNPNRNTMTIEELFNKNKLIPIWAGLTGTTWKVPAEAEEPKPKPPKPPRYPKQPRQFVNNTTMRTYLDPYAASKWYESRWEPAPVAPGDLPVPEW